MTLSMLILTTAKSKWTVIELEDRVMDPAGPSLDITKLAIKITFLAIQV